MKIGRKIILGVPTKVGILLDDAIIETGAEVNFNDRNFTIRKYNGKNYFSYNFEENEIAFVYFEKKFTANPKKLGIEPIDEDEISIKETFVIVTGIERFSNRLLIALKYFLEYDNEDVLVKYFREFI